jgi:hypothetical protein
MRKYSALMMLGLISMLLIALQLSASQAPGPTIEAEVNITPEVFNLNQKGVITAHVTNLTEEDVSYDVKDINISTIMLYHENTFVAEPLRVTVAGNTLIVKFDATAVADYVWSVVYHMGITRIMPQENYTMTFTVSGTLFGGEEFAGSDTIKVISP